MFENVEKYDIIRIEGYGGSMPSRMEKYYSSDEVKRRTNKNQDLYRTIYDEAEYSNVEGISVIEKNGKIDIAMIRELINRNNKPTEQKEAPQPISKIEEVIIEEEKNYDIRDILSKAKSERTDSDSKFANTQYNILKNISLNEELNNVKKVDEDDLKTMIEKISNNSKIHETGDLFDDLKSICDPNMKSEIEEKNIEENLDKSFYTSSLGFTNDDFEDLQDMKQTIKANNVLTRILLTFLILIVIAGVVFFIYYTK